MDSLDAGLEEGPHGRGPAVRTSAECRCGWLDCDRCPLTPRTVFLLGGELAWVADMADGDIADIVTGRRSITETAFAGLPEMALAWGSDRPTWLEAYARAANDYEARLHHGISIDPGSVAEEILLHTAFQAVRLEPDPDGALPPAALALPKLPGDYAWARAAEHVGFRPDLPLLYRSVTGALMEVDNALHPARWFEPYAGA